LIAGKEIERDIVLDNTQREKQSRGRNREREIVLDVTHRERKNQVRKWREMED